MERGRASRKEVDRRKSSYEHGERSERSCETEKGQVRKEVARTRREVVRVGKRSTEERARTNTEKGRRGRARRKKVVRHRKVVRIEKRSAKKDVARYEIAERRSSEPRASRKSCGEHEASAGGRSRASRKLSLGGRVSISGDSQGTKTYGLALILNRFGNKSCLRSFWSLRKFWSLRIGPGVFKIWSLRIGNVSYWDKTTPLYIYERIMAD